MDEDFVDEDEIIAETTEEVDLSAGGDDEDDLFESDYGSDGHYSEEN